MNVFIQIICILISFAYGFIINIGYKYNNKIDNSNFIWQLVFSLFYSFIGVLLYIIIIYKINGGIFHIYFIISLLVGNIVSNNIVKSIKIKRANN